MSGEKREREAPANAAALATAVRRRDSKGFLCVSLDSLFVLGKNVGYVCKNENYKI